MRNAFFIGFWLAFHFLFWKQGLGINAVVFGLGLQLYAKFDQGWKIHLAQEWVYVFAFLTSSFGLLYFQSGIAQFSFVVVNLAYFSFHYSSRFSPFEHFINALLRPFNIRKPLLAEPIFGVNRSKKQLFNYLSLSIIPLLLIIIFGALFRAGNPVFKEWSQKVLDEIASYLPNYDLSWFAFMFLGLLILRIVFIKGKDFYLLLPEGNYVVRKFSKYKRIFKVLGLKREYQMALMVFFSLNLLLLVVNLIDIRWFWFGFEMPQGFSLKEFLHEGVWALIMSLVLATAVSLYFFRGNLNFYPRNKFLQALAQLWVVQNMILAISVFLRSWYYIDFHGLASGRILVIALLSLVFFALVLLFVKIRTARNASFLVRWTSVYLGFLLGLCSLVNWDSMILKFNLDHGRLNEIDVDNYLYLHPRVYPEILKRLPRIEEQIEAHNENAKVWISVESIEEFQERLQKRIDRFIAAEEEQKWPAWNYAEAQAFAQLKGLKQGQDN